MNDPWNREMLEATRLTRAGQLTAATALLQRLLRGEATPYTTAAARGEASTAAPGRAGGMIDITPERSADPGPRAARRAPPTVEAPAFGTPAFGTMTWPQPADGAAQATRPWLPDALTGFYERLDRRGARAGLNGPAAPFPAPAPEPDDEPDGALFLAGSYSNHAGSRGYKLYVPSGYDGQPLPLIVMLHGCTQSPDDFAAGTRMNALAEEHACLVVYPEQARSANAWKCWKWFSRSDQQRDRGEPSLIAGITREIMDEYAVDPRRVYVAGLSAGAAAAAIMGATYPDLYAAIGVHSGLACGAAGDIPSALAAMRQGAAGPRERGGGTTEHGGAARIIPTIVFHGDRDTTVHPCNGDQVIAQVTVTELRTSEERGQVPGGHAYSRMLHTDAAGRPVLEQWTIHGAGHAWSGGSPAGSYTDPRGPNATREMLRFFLEHPHPTAAG